MKRYLTFEFDDDPSAGVEPQIYETRPVLEFLNHAYDTVARVLADAEHAGISDARDYDA